MYAGKCEGSEPDMALDHGVVGLGTGSGALLVGPMIFGKAGLWGIVRHFLSGRSLFQESEAIKRRKPTMWKIVRTMIVIAVVTVSLSGFQELVAGDERQETVTLQIDGMTCGGCVKNVKAALAKVPGVSEVGLSTGKKWIWFPDYSDARASVTFDPQKTNVEALMSAVEAAGNPLSKYRAQLRDR